MQVSSMRNISYTEKISSQNGTYGTSTAGERVARAESVTISNEGRAINDAISQAVN